MRDKQQALELVAKISKLIAENKAAMQKPCPKYQSENSYKITLVSISMTIDSLEKDLALAITYCE